MTDKGKQSIKDQFTDTDVRSPFAYNLAHCNTHI